MLTLSFYDSFKVLDLDFVAHELNTIIIIIIIIIIIVTTTAPFLTWANT